MADARTGDALWKWLLGGLVAGGAVLGLMVGAYAIGYDRGDDHGRTAAAGGPVTLPGETTQTETAATESTRTETTQTQTETTQTETGASGGSQSERRARGEERGRSTRGAGGPTLDGGGGTSIFGQGLPYFWGTGAITPDDAIPGLLMYTKTALPDAKTVGLTGWDIGEPNTTKVVNDVIAKVKAAGYEYNGLRELFPPSSTDFAATLTKIKANEPDILLGSMYGQDPGFFMDQAQTAGLKATLYGFEFTPDGVSASKGTYDSVGWTFAYDYFDANNPISPWAKLFVDEFKSAYGDDPDFYAANFYENTFVMWDVIRRVLAKGGDINDGAQLDAAFQENLTVPSLYGGDSSTVGSYTLDPTTHSVIKRPMGVFTYKDKKVTPLAYFGIGGEGYKTA